MTFIPMIIGEIRRYLRDNSSIRVSRSLRDTAYKALKVRDELASQNDADPGINEIAEALGMPREEVAYALDSIQDPVSLFEPIAGEGSESLCVLDQIEDRKNTDETLMKVMCIKEALGKLSLREKQILYMRFFKGCTQMEVSQEIGISQAQVSRLEKAALRQMKNDL